MTRYVWMRVGVPCGSVSMGRSLLSPPKCPLVLPTPCPSSDSVSVSLYVSLSPWVSRSSPSDVPVLHQSPTSTLPRPSVPEGPRQGGSSAPSRPVTSVTLMKMCQLSSDVLVVTPTPHSYSTSFPLDLPPSSKFLVTVQYPTGPFHVHPVRPHSTPLCTPCAGPTVESIDRPPPHT